MKGKRQSTNIEDKRAESRADYMYKGPNRLQTNPLMNRETATNNARSSRNQKAASMGNEFAISRVLGGQRNMTRSKTKPDFLEPKPVQNSYNFSKKRAKYGK